MLSNLNIIIIDYNIVLIERAICIIEFNTMLTLINSKIFKQL